MNGPVLVVERAVELTQKAKQLLRLNVKLFLLNLLPYENVLAKILYQVQAKGYTLPDVGNECRTTMMGL